VTCGDHARLPLFKSGTIGEDNGVAGDRPWWLMTTSARHGFLMSLLALGPASAFLVAGFLGKTSMLLAAAVCW
jgi:hypothetical protein